MSVVSIQTTESGARDLLASVSDRSDADCDARKIHAQVGDPDTWMFIGEFGPAALTALSATVLGLIRQRKVKYVKIGDHEFRDITVKQYKELVAMHSKDV